MTQHKKGGSMKRTKKAGRTGFCVAAAISIALVATNIQAADQSCVFNVSPQSVAVANDKAAQLSVVASGPACSFDVRSDVDWITVTPARVQGSGTVRLGIAPSAEARVGTVRIAGNEITVFQKGLADLSGYGR
jgi:hypothetical protein